MNTVLIKGKKRVPCWDHQAEQSQGSTKTHNPKNGTCSSFALSAAPDAYTAPFLGQIRVWNNQIGSILSVHQEEHWVSPLCSCSCSTPPSVQDGRSEHRVGTAGRSHCQALALVTLHLSLQCSEPGLLLLFKDFCSTQLTRTAAISPITGLQNLPQLHQVFLGEVGVEEETAEVPAKRDTPGHLPRHTGPAAALGIYLPPWAPSAERRLLVWVKPLMCCCCLFPGEKGHFHSCT